MLIKNQSTSIILSIFALKIKKQRYGTANYKSNEPIWRGGETMVRLLSAQGGEQPGDEGLRAAEHPSGARLRLHEMENDGLPVANKELRMKNKE